MGKGRFYFTKKSILLLIILIIPLILRFVQPNLEIYPAILFPSGAEMINIYDDTREFHSFEIYGLKDSLVNINKKEFLGNIPGQYFNYLIKSNFGLEPYQNSFYLFHPNLILTEKSNYNKKTRKEAESWIKEKLNEQGFNDSLLVIRRYKKQFQIKTKKIISKEVIYEKIFELN